MRIMVFEAPRDSLWKPVFFYPLLLNHSPFTKAQKHLWQPLEDPLMWEPDCASGDAGISATKIDGYDLVMTKYVGFGKKLKR